MRVFFAVLSFGAAKRFSFAGISAAVLSRLVVTAWTPTILLSAIAVRSLRPGVTIRARKSARAGTHVSAVFVPETLAPAPAALVDDGLPFMFRAFAVAAAVRAIPSIPFSSAGVAGRRIAALLIVLPAVFHASLPAILAPPASPQIAAAGRASIVAALLYTRTYEFREAVEAVVGEGPDERHGAASVLAPRAEPL